jgi:Protein of unknown function (DUF3040)
MTLSERDLRVLREIEHDLEIMDRARHRGFRLGAHPRAVGGAGLLIGAVLIGLGLQLTTAAGVVAAATGFVVMLLAAQVLVRWLRRGWLLGRAPRRPHRQ